MFDYLRIINVRIIRPIVIIIIITVIIIIIIEIFNLPNTTVARSRHSKQQMAIKNC